MPSVARASTPRAATGSSLSMLPRSSRAGDVFSTTYRANWLPTMRSSTRSSTPQRSLRTRTTSGSRPGRRPTPRERTRVRPTPCSPAATPRSSPQDVDPRLPGYTAAPQGTPPPWSSRTRRSRVVTTSSAPTPFEPSTSCSRQSSCRASDPRPVVRAHRPASVAQRTLSRARDGPFGCPWRRRRRGR
jgi:hypothetical protein